MQANEKQLAVADKLADDTLTLVSLGISAYALAIMSHEGIGHGLVALAAGAKLVLLTTCNVIWKGTISGVFYRWITAAGCIANVAVGLLSALALRLLRTAGPHQ